MIQYYRISPEGRSIIDFEMRDVYELHRKLLQFTADYDKTVNINWNSFEWFRDKVINGNGNVFAIKAGPDFNLKVNYKILGYCIAQITKQALHRDFAKAIEIEEIYIDPEYRGKGYAKNLINFATEQLMHDYKGDDLAKRVFLKVLSNNKCAIEAYKKMGFNEYENVLEKNI